MPCSHHLTSSSLGSVRSLFTSDTTQAATFLPILAAVCYTTIMAVSGVQLLRGRAWFLWTLLAASILETAGFIAGAIHAQDSRNHVAFIASFATVTIAPILLSIAAYTIFDRLIESVTPAGMASKRQSWLRLSHSSVALTIGQCAVTLPIAGFGLYRIGSFLSPAPIENHMGAFLRLMQYESGLKMLLLAHTVHLLSSVVFGIVGVVYMVKSTGWQANPDTIRGRNWRELLYTINAVNGVIAVRAAFKIYELVCIRSSMRQLGEGGPLFWMFDALPVLVALTMFCAIQPTAYLPRDVPSLILEPSQLSYPDEKKLLLERNW